jgi:hypothetical protein
MNRLLLARSARGLLLAAAITTVGACTTGRAYVRVGPPAPIYETRVAAPGPGYVWVEGYHRWEGGRYQWVPGYWVRPPRAHAVWVPGRWDHDGHGYYYVEGHWRG